MKKLGSIWLNVACCLFLCVGCGNQRYHYKKDDKIQASADIQLTRIYEPGLKANCIIADVVVEGTILEGTTQNISLAVGENDTNPKAVLPFTDFTVSIEQVLYGNVESEEILLHILGDETSMVTKPHSGDRVILFLEHREKKNYYILCDFENSMFICNPPQNNVFTFSQNSNIACYDGEPFSSLQEEIQKTYEEIYEELAENADLYQIHGGILEENISR